MTAPAPDVLDWLRALAAHGGVLYSQWGSDGSSARIAANEQGFTTRVRAWVRQDGVTLDRHVLTAYGYAALDGDGDR